jgi:hypothetical protein
MSRPAFQAGAQPEAGCQVGAGGDAGDRGSASLSYVVVMSAVLLLIALVLQSALWYHARNVAQAAAAEGLRATRLYDGTEGAGTQAATAFLRDAGGQLIADPAVAVTRTAVRARVEVRGGVASLIPGVALPIDEVAAGTCERFTPDAAP